MGKRRKTWQEKLANDHGFPRIGTIDETKSKRWGNGTFVIPALREVDALMRKVPRGQLTTIDDLRKALALRHNTTIACPLTTGIFAWIAAHAAAEAESMGKKVITPYWRTLKSRGELNPKFPGGIPALQQKLSEEGHNVIQKGKRFLIEDFSNKRVHF